MMHTKPWEETLAEVEERRRIPRHRAIAHCAKHKGRPPQRRCPDDFDVIFVEIGRLDCENWYRASRITVNRWLAERGKARLIKLRAEFVEHLRRQARMPKAAPANPRCIDRRRVDPALAQMAANHLRSSRNGGWMVSANENGDWWVGTVRRSPAELLSIAERKGFDTAKANLQIKAARAVSLQSCPAR